MSQPVTIKVLRDKFEAQVQLTPGLETFVFDDLDKINTDRDKDYPAFLLKPPTKFYSPNDPKTEKYYSFYNMDCFVFMLQSEEDDFDYAQAWETLEPLGRSVIDAIDRSELGAYYIASNVELEYGHHKHNDKLYGVRFKFRLRVYDGC